MGGLRNHATSVTLRDLRITKLSKAYRPAPCSDLFEAYMSAFRDPNGTESQVSIKTRLALHKCLEDRNVSKEKNPGIINAAFTPISISVIHIADETLQTNF